MNKAVLISIHPKWCELVASREKTIEVRKTRPKLEPPFKCYIYCTKPSFEHEDFLAFDVGTERAKAFYCGGKVIGEFVCDAIYEISFFASDVSFFDTEPPFPVPGTCLTDAEIANYLGNGKTGFGWHISDLVIYDEPKKLSEFRRHDATYDFAFFGEVCRTYSIQRPPQSWMYVEEGG